MPLTGTNFYGVQVQRTPYDDAEAQRASAQDAWRAMQHQNNWQNQRFQQGRSDAWAMNRDNLNFNAFSLDRADARSVAALEAQERLAKMGLDQNKYLFDEGNRLADARSQTAWDREQPWRTQQQKQWDVQNQQAGWQGEDRVRSLAREQAQRELDDLLAGLAADPSMADAGLDQFLSTAQGRIAEANKDRGADAQLRLPAQYLLNQISQRQARRDAAVDTRRDRLATEATGMDPRKRAAARSTIETDPTLKKEIDYGAAGPIPVNPQDPVVMDPIREAVASGTIRQAFSAFGRSRESSPEQAQADAAQLAAAIDAFATRLAASTGYDKSSIAKTVGAELQQLNTVGYPAFMRRPLSTLGSVIGIVDKPTTEREAAFNIVLQQLGLARPGE